eukprot:scaffold189801_cov17-Tisochrysis_lutea.AAC.1
MASSFKPVKLSCSNPGSAAYLYVQGSDPLTTMAHPAVDPGNLIYDALRGQNVAGSQVMPSPACPSKHKRSHTGQHSFCDKGPICSHASACTPMVTRRRSHTGQSALCDKVPI